MPEAPQPTPAPRAFFPTSPAAAAIVLALFWVLLEASLWNKSATYDETVHAVAGASYWRLDDYRLNPENGNLPQRVAGLPLALGPWPLPARGAGDWRRSREWAVGDAWLHHMGYDQRAMLRAGRAAAGLLAVALGALVWGLSRRLWGPSGGFVSLLAYVLNPVVLANGGLIASDTAAALFFLGSTAAVWAALKRGTAWSLLLAGLAAGCLCASKMSAFLILPIALLLAAIDVAGRPRGHRLRRAAAVAGGAAAAAAVAWGVIWAFYGFRYPAFSAGPGAFEPGWDAVLGAPPRSLAARAIGFASRHRLLPEAWLYGNAYALKFSHWRDAFLNGSHSLRGWLSYFPYAFLVKTPLPLFGVMALAAAGMAGPGRRGAPLKDCVPFAILIAVDGLAAVLGRMDIGIRHVLPAYAALFVLCGAAAAAPAPGIRPARLRGAALGVLVAAMAAETLWRFPDYLAYFNGIVRPSQGYRHLVDSSLDWGQDLPAARAYVDGHPSDGPFYLCYFGSDSPAAYGIRAIPVQCASPSEQAPGSLAVMTLDFPAGEYAAGLASFLRDRPEYEAAGSADVDGSPDRRAFLIKKAPDLRLRPGTYLVSATALQAMEYNLKAPWGPWNARFEARYRALGAEVAPLLGDDPRARAAALARGTTGDWLALLNDLLAFDALRFARLKAHLRTREPDANLHGSILVFKVGAAELREALEGPPPELGRDLPAELEASGLLDP
jgi:hypothetical protein